jgi:hypothetical protein
VYAASFNRTELYGGVTSTARTEDETLYAHFWADVPGHSVTPPGHWDEIAEHVTLQQHLNLEQNARLFALLNIGLADAAITCWDAKYVYNFWRPVTAINDPRASQISPATASDPTWVPLWKTPNFPSYMSGHSTFSGAAATILTSVFGPDFLFTVGSDDMPGYSRSFDSFAQAAEEAGESRVMGGIHFEFDNTAGLRSGWDLGTFVSQNFLLPRGRPGSEAGEGSPRAPRDAATAPTEGATSAPGPIRDLSPDDITRAPREVMGAPGLLPIPSGALLGGATGQSFLAGNLEAEGTGQATPADGRNADPGTSPTGRPPEHAPPGAGLAALHLLSGKRRLWGDFSEPNVL